MKHRFLPIMLFAVLILGIVYVRVGVASPKTTVSVEPPDNTGAVGTIFTVNITVTDVTELYGWEFQLSYNPGILNVTKVSEGPFLKAKEHAAGTLFVRKINSTSGVVNALATFNPPYPTHGVNGSGVLATITFSVKGEGTTTLDLDTYEPRGLRTISGTQPIVIPHDEVDGSFSNRAELPLQTILVAIVIIVIVGAGAFLFWRRKRPMPS